MSNTKKVTITGGASFRKTFPCAQKLKRGNLCQLLLHSFAQKCTAPNRRSPFRIDQPRRNIYALRRDGRGIQSRLPGLADPLSFRPRADREYERSWCHKLARPRQADAGVRRTGHPLRRGHADALSLLCRRPHRGYHPVDVGARRYDGADKPRQSFRVHDSRTRGDGDRHDPLELAPRFHPLPQDDHMQCRPDISAAREQVGWEPTVSLEDGLARTIAFFGSRIGGATQHLDFEVQRQSSGAPRKRVATSLPG